MGCCKEQQEKKSEEIVVEVITPKPIDNSSIVATMGGIVVKISGEVQYGAHMVRSVEGLRDGEIIFKHSYLARELRLLKAALEKLQ